MIRLKLIIIEMKLKAPSRLVKMEIILQLQIMVQLEVSHKIRQIKIITSSLTTFLWNKQVWMIIMDSIKHQLR